MCERRIVERKCFDIGMYVVYLSVVCELCLTLCGVYCVLIDENALIVNVSVLPFARYVFESSFIRIHIPTGRQDEIKGNVVRILYASIGGEHKRLCNGQ